MLQATERNGVVYVSNSFREVSVSRGRSPKLVAGNMLWWLSGTTLQHAVVGNSLSVGASTVVTTTARSYALRDMADVGIAAAWLSGASLIVTAAGTTYTLAWDSARSDDFDFEFSIDMQALSVIYRLPGSPLQAFVATYEYENDTFIVVDSTLRVFDFELGARALDPKAVNLTR